MPSHAVSSGSPSLALSVTIISSIRFRPGTTTRCSASSRAPNPSDYPLAPAHVVADYDARKQKVDAQEAAIREFSRPRAAS